MPFRRKGWSDPHWMRFYAACEVGYEIAARSRRRHQSFWQRVRLWWFARRLKFMSNDALQVELEIRGAKFEVDTPESKR
jgi:hypothetical protein